MGNREADTDMLPGLPAKVRQLAERATGRAEAFIRVLMDSYAGYNENWLGWA